MRRLKVVKIGRRTLIRENELQRFMESQLALTPNDPPERRAHEMPTND